ncbi:MAG: hypothetical protein K2W95_24895 [Candidatus Obscuribacterales bacterium]|nr:hypothetical protein [Candidatus Obscuribacterales bacterium]
MNLLKDPRYDERSLHSPELPFPFPGRVEGRFVKVAGWWRSNTAVWIRLLHPDTSSLFDFRVLDIFTTSDGEFMRLKSARRWHARRRHTSCSLVKLTNVDQIQTLTESELCSLESQLSSQSTIPNNHQLGELLRSRFGSSIAPDQLDIAIVANLETVLYGSNGLPTEADQMFDLALDCEPGFATLTVGELQQTLNVAARFHVDEQEYLAVREHTDFAEGKEKPSMIVLKLLSDSRAITISAKELRSIAIQVMDSIEIH